MPNLSVNVNIPEEQSKELIKTEELTKYYNEVLDEIREDRKEIDNVLKNFEDMVMNEGDATTSSKEALVNLLKLKADVADKKIKVIDLLTRAHLKEKDTFPKYLAAHQHNEIRIEDTNTKRQFLKGIQKNEN